MADVKVTPSADAVKPKNMSDDAWEQHVKDAQAETARRAAVEANPTDTMLDVIRRVEALEAAAKPVAPAPAAEPVK